MSNSKIVVSLKNDLKKIKDINIHLQDYQFLLETYESILNKFVPFKKGDKVKVSYRNKMSKMSGKHFMSGEIGIIEDVGFNKYSGPSGEFYVDVKFDSFWWFSTLENKWKKSDRPRIYSINPKHLEKVSD